MPSISIIMPTHCRNSTASKTLKQLYSAYTTLGFTTHIICIDSSPEVSPSISDLEFVQYIHVPGHNLYQKFSVARQLLRDSLIKSEFILWTPDDDLFLPNDPLLQFCSLKVSQISNYYIPFRYAFFSQDAYAPDALRVVDSWTHHVHISKVGLSSIDQLNTFVDQGVNSCWGIFSKNLFKTICDMTSSCLEVLSNQYSYILMEDCWNILILSADWVSLQKHPICLRGLDRRYHNDADHVPSWVALRRIVSANKHIKLARIVYFYLSRISREISMFSVDDGIKFSFNLLKRHSDGYQSAASRAYVTSLPLIFAPSSLRDLQHPKILIRDKAQNHSLILMPNSFDSVNTLMYPQFHILSDSSLLFLIYKYLPYFTSNRDS